MEGKNYRKIIKYLVKENMLQDYFNGYSRPVGSFLKKGVQILHLVQIFFFLTGPPPASKVAQVLKQLMSGGLPTNYYPS